MIELAEAKGIGSKRSRISSVLKVSWRKSPPRRRREILVPASVPPQDARAIRSENRALLVASIARGRRWLEGLRRSAIHVSSTPTLRELRFNPISY